MRQKGLSVAKKNLAIFGVVSALVILLGTVPAVAELFEDQTPETALDRARFYIGHSNQYAGASWIYENSNNKIIGYASWNAQNRRWTLFTLRGEYYGYIQATVGTTAPPHYRQYLWYDKDHRYKGVFVAHLGGRPVTPDLPFGELGGQLELNEIGNIPPLRPSREVEPDPLRRLPYGRDSGE